MLLGCKSLYIRLCLYPTFPPGGDSAVPAGKFKVATAEAELEADLEIGSVADPELAEVRFTNCTSVISCPH